MKDTTKNAMGTIVSAPVSLCTGKVIFDVTTKLLPRHVGIPLKVAHTVGTVGLTIISDYLVRNAIGDALEVVDAAEEVRQLNKAQKEAEKRLKEGRS